MFLILQAEQADVRFTQEKFEDAKGVIISGKSKERQRNGQKKKDKITIYKSLHRKLRIEQQDEQEEARIR